MGEVLIKSMDTGMGGGRSAVVALAPLDFESISKKRLFSYFRVGKKRILPLLPPPLEKFWKNTLVLPLEKILPTPMGTGRGGGVLCDMMFGLQRPSCSKQMNTRRHACTDGNTTLG